MKKIILTTSFFLLACFVSNNTATAGCEQTLVAQLRACVNQTQAAKSLSTQRLRVVVKDGFVYVEGDSGGSDAQMCIGQYNSASNTCPAAPQLVMGSDGSSTESFQ